MNAFQRFIISLVGINPTEFECEVVCESCESLKSEVEHLRYQNKRFMDNLLIKPEPEPTREPPVITRPKHVPWNVRKNMLEREDREKAEARKAEIIASRNAGTPDKSNPMMDTADLEREMDMVTSERENGAKH